MTSSFANAERFVRDIRGPAASILMVLYLTQESFTARELEAATGYTDKPIMQGLRQLERYGLVKHDGHREGWSVTHGSIEDFISQLRSRDEARSFVYLIAGAGLFKIGKAGDPERRIKQLRTLSPSPIELAHVIPCDNATAAESELHQRFHGKRANGEWFRLDEADVAYIKTLCGYTNGAWHEQT